VQPRSLANPNIDTGSRYVKIWLHTELDGERVKNSKAKTSVIKKDLNPVWDETLKVNGVTKDNIDSLYFHIEVMDYDLLGTNDFLGHAWVAVAPAVAHRGVLEVKLRDRDDLTPWARGPPSRPPPPPSSAPARPPPPGIAARR
jgi:hypothetical protein